MGVAIIVAALIGAIWLEPKWMLIVIAVTAMAGASVVSFIRKWLGGSSEITDIKTKIQLDRLGRAYSSAMGTVIAFGMGLSTGWIMGRITVGSFNWGILVVILGGFVAQLLFDKFYDKLIEGAPNWEKLESKANPVVLTWEEIAKLKERMGIEEKYCREGDAENKRLKV